MYKEVYWDISLKILHTFNVQGCYKTDTQQSMK